MVQMNSTAEPSATVESANKSLVRRIFEAVDRGELDCLDDFLTVDYLDHNPLPVPDLSPGRDGAKQAFAVNLAAFSDPWHRVEQQVAEHDLVVSRIAAGGRHTGDLVGISPTGQEVSMTGIAIHRVEGGRLAERWAQADLFGLFIQLGVVTPPGAQHETHGKGDGRQ